MALHRNPFKTWESRKSMVLAVFFFFWREGGWFNLARFYVGLLQISGPKGGQSWVLPTKVVVEIADIQGPA